MNTLSKEITSKFFKTEDGYQQLIKGWSELVRAKYEFSAEEFMLYAILRGKDWRKGFKSLTPRVEEIQWRAINGYANGLFKTYFKDIFAADGLALAASHVKYRAYIGGDKDAYSVKEAALVG